jgi:hypothetical protein
LLKEFAADGGVLVGWQIDSDLEAMLFHEAAAQVQAHRRQVSLTGGVTACVCELQDFYRTGGGGKCTLGEAYRGTFGRSLVSHNAGDDALMTMELYKHHVALGRPAKITVDLTWFVVTAHNFQPAGQRSTHLWQFLRPRTRDTDVVKEAHDEATGKVTFKFRLQAERDVFLVQVKQALGSSWGAPAMAANPPGSHEHRCGAFVLHVRNETR